MFALQFSNIYYYSFTIPKKSIFSNVNRILLNSEKKENI